MILLCACTKTLGTRGKFLKFKRFQQNNILFSFLLFDKEMPFFIIFFSSPNFHVWAFIYRGKKLVWSLMFKKITVRGKLILSISGQVKSSFFR
jgi:hypothetical protein